jgi:hypothetical protein
LQNLCRGKPTVGPGDYQIGFVISLRSCCWPGRCRELPTVGPPFWPFLFMKCNGHCGSWYWPDMFGDKPSLGSGVRDMCF